MEQFKSGTYINQGYYKSFQPEFINREWQLNDMTVLQLLSQADRHLGRLDMYSEYVNMEMFIQMHIAKEATQSSKIEGTQTNIEDTFLEEKEVISEKRDDWEEVRNYISAMKEAVELLHTLPFSSRLIRETHKVLLQGVRGEHKQPGEYRTSQNWIGGASINDAVFVPPVHTSLPELMSDLEKFANDESNPLPDLLKIAIIHYQFETIHPFLDGNGRIGRLLITLFLMEQNLLSTPALYISYFLKQNRIEYYDRMTEVRRTGNYEQWILFFLRAVAVSAADAVAAIDDLHALHEKNVTVLTDGTNKKQRTTLTKLFSYLEAHPLIEVKKTAEVLGTSYNAVSRAVAVLIEKGILEQQTQVGKTRIYSYAEYLEILRGDT